MNYNPIEQQLKEVMLSHGLTPPDVIQADGSLHRFASNGKPGDNSGSYVLHTDGAIPAGWIGDWRTGVSTNFRADIGRKPTPIEESEHLARVETIKRDRKAEEEKHHAEAREKASLIWAEAKPCSSHAYLTHKGINKNGARLYNDSLVIPMRDECGVLHSLQFIDADGNKRFLKGGRVAGCYHSIGKLKDATALCIAEGYATCATIIEATKFPVVVTFSAGNIEAVARIMRIKSPDLTLILCGDVDKSGVGQSSANIAALAVSGFVAIPPFTEEELAKNPPPSDWNDFASIHGLENTFSTLISSTLKTGVLGVLGVETSNGAGLSGTPAKTADVLGVPGEKERPCFKTFDSEVALDKSTLKPGVYYFGKKETKEKIVILTQQWICTPLHIDAVTFDSRDNNFGRLLRFKTTTGKWRTWAMPMDLLSGSGEGLRGELLAMGVSIDPNSHRLLGQYLQDKTPKESMRCALQVGWCGDSFVLPDVVIGEQSSKVIFQSGERGHEEFTCGGTLEGWQSEISSLATGNPTLTNALSTSFVGAILKKCNAESGGIHYSGESSTGKSTLLKAACSTWGGASYSRSWRATANGMEAVASLFNDGLLALDEISEANPKEIGAIIYCLGNGTGKQRASRTGNARGVTRWRCMIMSSGERSIETAMQEVGHRVMAGQSMRLLDIPMTGRFGAWDDLHHFSSGAAFSDAIRQSATTHYGHAGRAFLEKLTRDNRDFGECLERFRALPEFSIDDGEGQDKRAASRFALLAFAGTLATEYGITGWAEDAAIKAAEKGLKAWQSLHGKGNSEKKDTMNQLAGFIEMHGDSRFSNADTPDTMRINRAGYWRGEGEERVYLFNTAGLHDALRGFNFKQALDFLQSEGVIPPSSGVKSKSLTLCGQKGRFYSVQVSKLWGNDGH